MKIGKTGGKPGTATCSPLNPYKVVRKINVVFGWKKDIIPTAMAEVQAARRRQTGEMYIDKSRKKAAHLAQKPFYKNKLRQLNQTKVSDPFIFLENRYKRQECLQPKDLGMPRKCAKCGMESELENDFFPVHDPNGNKVFYCSTCWEKYSILQGGSCLIACLTLLIGGFVWVMFSPQHELARLVFQTGLFMCFLFLSTVIHEFGHVLAAFVARIKVLQVNVGLGKLLYKCHFLGIEWCFHMAPVSGFVIPDIRSTRFYRTRNFIFTAGGSLFNFLMCIGGILLFFHISLGWLTVLLRLFIFANLFDGVWSLIPRKVNIAGTNTPCDGLILLKLPFMSQSEIEHHTDQSN